MQGRQRLARVEVSPQCQLLREQYEDGSYDLEKLHQRGLIRLGAKRTVPIICDIAVTATDRVLEALPLATVTLCS